MIGRTGVVVLAVAVGVEPRRVPLHPVVEHVERTARRARSAPHRRAAPGSRPARPVTARPRSRRGSSRSRRRPSVTFAGNLSNSSTRWTEPNGASSPCMNPGADWLFQFSSRPAGPADAVRVLRAVQEAAPLVVAGAERRQPPVETGRATRQQPRREVGGRGARRVRPVEREAELVRDLEELGRRLRRPVGHVLERGEVQTVAAERRALAGQRDRPALRRSRCR